MSKRLVIDRVPDATLYPETTEIQCHYEELPPPLDYWLRPRAARHSPCTSSSHPMRCSECHQVGSHSAWCSSAAVSPSVEATPRITGTDYAATWFDREVCPCGAMHERWTCCGLPVDGCDLHDNLS